jgi:hypothetical protein
MLITKKASKKVSKKVRKKEQIWNKETKSTKIMHEKLNQIQATRYERCHVE